MHVRASAAQVFSRFSRARLDRCNTATTRSSHKVDPSEATPAVIACCSAHGRNCQPLARRRVATCGARARGRGGDTRRHRHERD